MKKIAVPVLLAALVLTLTGLESLHVDTTEAASSLPRCMLASDLRRSYRLMDAGRPAECDTATALSGEGLAACNTYGAYRRATRLQRYRLPVACYIAGSPFAPGNSSSSSSSSSSNSSSSSSSSSVPSGSTYDTGDTTIRGQFLPLNEVSPVLGSVNIFLDEEPLNVKIITVVLSSDAQSIQSLLVYDDDKRLLGRATLDAGAQNSHTYRATLPLGTFQVGKREERKIYFRAQLSSHEAGGRGGQVAQINSVVIDGTGEWSTRRYIKTSASTDVFPMFETARGTIVRVINAMQTAAPLLTGPNQKLGSFMFIGRTTDSSAELAVTTLVFQIEQTGGITLGNTYLATPGSSETYPCTIASGLVTCNGIPASFGTLGDGSRTISVHGDIASSDQQRASFRLTLNQAGDPNTDGSISWTDGTSTYDWVGTESPVVQGTYFSY